MNGSGFHKGNNYAIAVVQDSPSDDLQIFAGNVIICTLLSQIINKVA